MEHINDQINRSSDPISPAEQVDGNSTVENRTPSPDLVSLMRKNTTLPGAIGPKQLSQHIDRVIKDTVPQQWKNIPMPVCQATSSILSCINDLRRFAISQETRISNLFITHNQSILDAQRTFSDQSAFLEIEAKKQEKRLLEVVQENKDQIFEKLRIDQQNNKTEQAKILDERMIVELQGVKAWALGAINDKTGNAERTLKALIADQFRNFQKQFLVPGIIGGDCPNKNFIEYVIDLQNTHLTDQQAFEKLRKKQENLEALYLQKGKEMGLVSQNQDNLTFNFRALDKQIKEQLQTTNTSLSETIQKNRQDIYTKLTVLSQVISQNAYAETHRDFIKEFLVNWPELQTKINLAINDQAKLQDELFTMNVCLSKLEDQVQSQVFQNHDKIRQVDRKSSKTHTVSSKGASIANEIQITESKAFKSIGDDKAKGSSSVSALGRVTVPIKNLTPSIQASETRVRPQTSKDPNLNKTSSQVLESKVVDKNDETYHMQYLAKQDLQSEPAESDTRQVDNGDYFTQKISEMMIKIEDLEQKQIFQESNIAQIRLKSESQKNETTKQHRRPQHVRSLKKQGSPEKTSGTQRDYEPTCTLLEALGVPNTFKKIRLSQSPPDGRDEITSSLPYYAKPLEWDSTFKKWIAADHQTTVKTSFKMPVEDPIIVNNFQSSQPIKKIRSSSGLDPSVLKEAMRFKQQLERNKGHLHQRSDLVIEAHKKVVGYKYDFQKQQQIDNDYLIADNTRQLLTTELRNLNFNSPGASSETLQALIRDHNSTVSQELQKVNNLANYRKINDQLHKQIPKRPFTGNQRSTRFNESELNSRSGKSSSNQLNLVKQNSNYGVAKPGLSVDSLGIFIQDIPNSQSQGFQTASYSNRPPISVRAVR